MTVKLNWYTSNGKISGSMDNLYLQVHQEKLRLLASIMFLCIRDGSLCMGFLTYEGFCSLLVKYSFPINRLSPKGEFSNTNEEWSSDNQGCVA